MINENSFKRIMSKKKLSALKFNDEVVIEMLGYPGKKVVNAIVNTIDENTIFLYAKINGIQEYKLEFYKKGKWAGLETQNCYINMARDDFTFRFYIREKKNENHKKNTNNNLR